MKDLSQILVTGLGKKMVDTLAREACSDEDFFIHLLEIVEVGEKPASMKSAWILGTASKLDAGFTTKYASRILAVLRSTPLGGVQRELMKAISTVRLKDQELGLALDLSFRFLADAHSDLAVKYHAANVIEKALKKYPELKGEYVELLRNALLMHTDAWKRYIAKRIQKLEKS